MKPSRKHGLTPTFRKGEHIGWVKRINCRPKWICSAKQAPMADAADEVYEIHFASLWQPPEDRSPKAIVLVKDICDYFLDRKRSRIGQETRGIGQRTYDEYDEVLQAFCAHQPKAGDGEPRTIGQTEYESLAPDDFGSFHRWLNDRFGVDRMKKYIVIVRSVFKLATQPPIRLPIIDYGDQFPLPSRADERRARKRSREKHGPKFFEPVEIRAQLDGQAMSKDELKAEAKRRKGSHRGLVTDHGKRIRGAGTMMRAAILAAVNCGFGNTDIAELPLSVARKALEDGWIDYDRGKTGARRLAWLWPETIAAWKAYLKVRPEPASEQYKDLLFLTRAGLPYVHGRKDQIALRHLSLMRRLKQRRRGRNFYSLRRTYRTIAFEVGKELVINLSMGHAGEAEDMAKVYTVSDMRNELKKVSNHVRHRVLNV